MWTFQVTFSSLWYSIPSPETSKNKVYETDFHFENHFLLHLFLLLEQPEVIFETSLLFLSVELSFIPYTRMLSVMNSSVDAETYLFSEAVIGCYTTDSVNFVL